MFEVVRRLLGQRWSPEQIALTLAALYPKGHGYRVSTETIYNCIYAQAKPPKSTVMAVVILPGAQEDLLSLQAYMLDKWSEADWLKAENEIFDKLALVDTGFLSGAPIPELASVGILSTNTSSPHTTSWCIGASTATPMCTSSRLTDRISRRF